MLFNEEAITFMMAVGFSLVHIFGGALRFLYVIPRSRLLSFSGGISVAYVFVRLFPELREAQRLVEESGALAWLEYHAYVLSLSGLIVFYGLERLVKSSRAASSAEHGLPEPVFWLHIGSFSLYNFLIGYLLLNRPDDRLINLLIYFVAIGLHFLVNDYGLRSDHKQDYDRRARWILAAAVPAGWLSGSAFKIPELTVVALTAFLAGGIVMNVIKEELPEERESRFSAFVTGAVFNTALLLLVA